MDQIDRWLKGYSDSTKDKYRRALRVFCEFHNVTWEETLKLEAEEAEDMIHDWQVDRVGKRAGKTVSLEFSAVKGWFLFNRIRVMVRLRNVSLTKTYLDYIPSRRDVQRLIDAAKLHHKVAIGLLAFSGLRPVDVVNLRYKHIKASYERGEEVLTIVLKHRKTRQWYVSFVGPQCTRYIKSYLTARQDKGERITDESPLVRWHSGALQSVSLRIAVMRIIENTVGRHPTGEEFRKFRPYGLRKYFRRTLNRIGESEAEYLMGHSKGLESLTATYGGLRDMDPQAIAALKKKYVSVLPELETEVTDTILRAKLEQKEKERKQLAESLGGIREELDELKELMELMRKR